MHIPGLLLIGLFGGALGGVMGIGGGIIIVPMLVMFLGFAQKTAQGTTLAMMLPPIGLFAVMSYHKRGYVDFYSAALLCVGFVIGSILGSETAVRIDTEVLKRVFGAVMILAGAKMLF